MQDFQPRYALPFDLSLVQKAAELGEPHAMWRLAAAYLGGEQVVASAEKAATWLEAAARAGHGIAAFDLAALLESGRLGVIHPATILFWYELAAFGQAVGADFEVGQRLLVGSGAPVNRGMARRHFERGSMNGHGRCRLALHYLELFDAPLPTQLGDAVRRIDQAAHAGDGLALYARGTTFQHGLGRELQMEKAEASMRAAAAAGYAPAMRWLGVHLRGSGTTDSLSYSQALGMMGQAARSGDVSAMAIYGAWLLEPGGPMLDEGQGRLWLDQALATGHPLAVEISGICQQWASPRGLEETDAIVATLIAARERGYHLATEALCDFAFRNYEALRHRPELSRWLTLGAVHNCIPAVAQLGVLQLWGSGAFAGIPDNQDLGLFWLQHAAEHGDLWAMEQLAHSYLSAAPGKRRVAASVALLSSAAFLGHVDAAATLAELLTYGTGLVRHPYFGAKLNEWAAQRGSSIGAGQLAWQLEHGQGVETDQAAADHWWEHSNTARGTDSPNAPIARPAHALARKRPGKVLDLRPRLRGRSGGDS